LIDLRTLLACAIVAPDLTIRAYSMTYIKDFRFALVQNASMNRTPEEYLRKAHEVQDRAAALTDPWLKRSMEEIANGYRLMAERAAKDGKACVKTR
jgi:hypothetical protein